MGTTQGCCEEFWTSPTHTLLQKELLYSHLSPISQIIKGRSARHAGHCWKSKDKLISDILQWTPTHEHTNIAWSAKYYIHQLRADLVPSRRLTTSNRNRCWELGSKESVLSGMPWWSWYMRTRTHIYKENFSNIRQWSGRPGFNPRLSHTKDSKMLLNGALLCTQHYKVRIKSKMKQSRERSSTLPYTLV